MTQPAPKSASIPEAKAKPAASGRPAYEPPRVTVMDEADVLKTFQFTSASISWWVS